jgi:hypothetical protein
LTQNAPIDREPRDGKVYACRTEERSGAPNGLTEEDQSGSRGDRKMTDESRYCLDELQEADPIVAAMRELELRIMLDHLKVGMKLPSLQRTGQLT